MSNPEHSARSVTTPDPDALEVVAGTAHEQIEGWIPELASDDAVRDALEKAFDYRGDVTVTRKDGTTVDGYLFDRRSGKSLQDSFVRIIPRNTRDKISLAYSESRRSLSPGATRPLARAGKRGYESIGKRRRQEKPISG